MTIEHNWKERMHMDRPGMRPKGARLLAGMFVCLAVTGLLAAQPMVGLSNHGGDHDFAYPPEEGVELAEVREHIRVAWSNPTYTGYIKGGSGSAMEALEAGLEPAYGEAASPVLSDGVLLVSWSQPSGTVTARLESIKHRYFRDQDRNKALADTYFRIDADWHTLALDAETGKTLWRRVERSASMNFLSNKRDHNGISGAARDGVYVTITLLGHVYAYDLKTGKTRWTTTLKEWNERAEETKKDRMAKRAMPYLDTEPFGHKRSGAIIVDGIAVVPDLRGGLIGVKLSDGSQIWQTADCLHHQATPRPWRHKGKTWLVCNDAKRGGSGINLIDPLTGKVQWSHKTGFNPGQLLMGEGYILLNADPKATSDCVYTCYAITSAGLKERWAFEDTEANRIEIKADFGAHRKGVIRDGVLYAKLGVGRGKAARMVSVDLATGKQLHAEAEPALGLNAGQPFIAEDKLYVQCNSAHSGSKAGLYVYQLEGKGRLRYLGEVMYAGLGVSQATSYQYPIETPYAGGKLYMRAKTQIVAIDLTKVTAPMAEIKLENVWAGFHRPVEAVVFADQDGTIRDGRLESPPRKELGIVGTPGHRNDSWMPLNLSTDARLGSGLKTRAELGFVPFSWPATITMEPAKGDQWNGAWSRHFAGWDETVTRSGTLDESSEGGYGQRGWPTGWLKDQPVSFFSDLPEGQQRVFLQLPAFTPAIPDVKAPQSMTLCLDHDGKAVKAGIGGAFGFNQSCHEIDVSELEVTGKGIKGSAIVILNPDPWLDGDYQNGGSLAGRVKVDITFGKANDRGIYPVRGDWSVEWGLAMTRSGAIRATLKNMP